MRTAGALVDCERLRTADRSATAKRRSGELAADKHEVRVTKRSSTMSGILKGPDNPQ